ncbi:MAG: ABC transporter ATP-binding protein [Myxococcales bacterium]|nr:MAG: ABC transporter ATP-binding protein [Myxococcales bacterium]
MRIELKHISKSFAEHRALNDLSLCIAKGSKLALIGPNGSGKTTLVRIALGLLRSKGSVCFNGEQLINGDLEFTRHIGYVPQISPQLKAPVGEIVKNICMVREAPVDDVHILAAELGLDLDAIATQSFRSLSGGMKQKLVIALALFSKPTFIVMDEPTASLDSGSRQAFFKLLPHYTRHSTMLLSSHRLDELTHLVDEVALLQQGRLVFSGSARVFLDDHATSIVELHVPQHKHDEWLAARGFEPALGRWWISRVKQKDKISLLASTMKELGSDLAHLYVQDIESVELGLNSKEQVQHE